jgi:hypothetical protein
MKYLKTFEEISPEYIQSKIAGKPDSPQKDRLQKAADDKKEMRTREENQKKSQQQEQERMKNPEYAMSKQLAQKRNQLADSFTNQKLNLYFAPMNLESGTVLDGGKGCFEISCSFRIGDDDSDGFAGYSWYDNLDSFEDASAEIGPFLGAIMFEGGNSREYNDYKRVEGLEVQIEDTRDSQIQFIITKDGIQVLVEGIRMMESVTGEVSEDFEYEKIESFRGVKLVGMDAASKNKLANFIKQYASGATTGNNNLKVNGAQMPVFGKDFNYEKFKPLDLKDTQIKLTDLPQHSEPVQTTANKEESEAPEKLGDKVKSFLGFKK